MMLETKRLIIRRFIDTDKDDFIKLIKDKMGSKYSIYDHQYPTDEENISLIFEYYCRSDEFYAVEIKEEQRLIGFISLNHFDEKTRNLGYCLHSDHHRKGLGKEMVSAIIKYARDVLKLKKLVAGTAEENIPSFRLLQGLGFNIVKKELASFTNDEKGDPITFVGCSFEYIL
ncbi:MAG TPA: GNAT family N-acetyltransferase [Acholeplasmataceae bacterium]|jgi:ribosomal-protein-alanine N-acetyltransferase|nr:GNAT family N-acetyltransferase [Acholeplasmataceae bacterium]